MAHGFSLVELSIVLVILGLLTGGILAGQSLIRASELRSISSDFARYQTAIHTFRDKYFAIPGDMSNATKFWGDDNAACPDAAIPNGSPGTCNGDGDGLFDAAAANGATSEEYQLWKQLALASLIEGTYTGTAGASSTIQAIIGTNCPRSRISNGGFSAYHIGVRAGDLTFYDGNYGNILQVGAQFGTSRTGSPIIKAEEAWNIDTKMDDGRPAFGNLRGDRPTSSNAPNCSDNDTASIAQYKFSDPDIECRLTLITGF